MQKTASVVAVLAMRISLSYSVEDLESNSIVCSVDNLATEEQNNFW